MPGYMEMIENLNNDFPLSEPQIIGEQNHERILLHYLVQFYV